MAGNVRFELSSASAEEFAFGGNYMNGQRGNYPNASLDRSGSFREGNESRIFCGTGTSRGSATIVGDVPLLSQWLMLDPIAMEDQTYTRSGELRRVLGISLGGTTEDNSFGAAHLKPPPPVATEELKRFKKSVLDASMKARDRAEKLDESLQRLNKYCEAFNPKKQQRNEMVTNERSGGSNLLKMGTLLQRNPSDLVTSRLEDRTKNVVLNKRMRSSMADFRAEGRGNPSARLPVLMGKDKEMLKDGGEGSDLAEEKIRRLPAGGEGWEKKMKRKRSVGAVFTRSVDGDGEIKRVMHNKLNNDPGLQSFDSQGVRSGSSNGTNGVNKLENISLPANANIRVTPRGEQEKISFSRHFPTGSTKDRIIAKGNNKLNMREDNNVGNLGVVTKGKASRAPRTSPIMVANSSSNFSRLSGAQDGWEQPPIGNKVQPLSAANNRKRPLPTGSSSPPMAQWVGQRPQKSSRTRRANLMSPVSNHEDTQLPPEGCLSSDLSGRITSSGVNSLLCGRGVASGTQQIKVKNENVCSPARLSESEESTAGENRDSRLKEKGPYGSEAEGRTQGAVQNVGPSVLLSKKNKMKEEIGDSVRRQGRSGRGSSFPRANGSPMREKLENTASTKPLKNARPGSDKSGSKSGRPPLKKLSDRKAFTRLGLTQTGSADLMGEVDDDREDLLAAAKFACNASYLACSSSFWKHMDPIFASPTLEDTSYLKQQLKATEELNDCLSQICGHGSNIMGNLVHDEDFLSEAVVLGEKEQDLHVEIDSHEPAMTADLVDQAQRNGTSSRRLGLERKNKVTPLYQRVLAALIVEDETEEFEENGGGISMSFQYYGNHSSGGTCVPINDELRKRDRIVLEHESVLQRQAQEQYSVGRPSCNGSTSVNIGMSIHNELCHEDYLQDGHGFGNLEIGIFPELSKNGVDGPVPIEIDGSGIPYVDCQYEKMCLEDKLMLELQSIGISLEAVPDLADGEDETVDQEIVELQKELQKRVVKRKDHLSEILKSMEEIKRVEKREREQVGMDRIVELAYRKQLATRGSSTSKSGVTKVSKQVALAFMTRILARCHKFEESGQSCFSEPSLQDVLFAAPARGYEGMHMQTATRSSQAESGASGSFHSRAEWIDIRRDKVGRGSLDLVGTLGHSSDQEFARTGPILNRGKKKEVLLDDVGGSASLKAASSLVNTLPGGAKGKRSERERDKDVLVKTSVIKAGRGAVVNCKGERKTKSKPKQKTTQPTSSGNGFVNKLTEASDSVFSATSGSREVVTNGSNKKSEIGLTTPSSIPQDSSQELKEPIELQLHEFDSIGLGGDFFNLDDDGLQDHDDNLQDLDLMGLDIPMDDLSELNMF